MTCDEILRDAAGFAALPPGDPEREAAYRHAADCPGCLEALARSEAVLGLLDALPAPEPPPASVLARVSAELRAALARADRMTGRAAALASVLACAALLLFAHQHAPEAPAWIGAAVLVLGAAAAALAGVRRGLASVVGVAALSTVLGLLFGRSGELVPAAGVDCFVSEVVAGLAAFAVAVWVRRRTGEPASASALGAVAAAGALGGQAALAVVCGARDVLSHLLVFHTGGILVAAMIGASLGATRLVRGIG